MRILIGHDTYPPDINGAAAFSRRLARGLGERGHEVHVAVPGRTRRAALEHDGPVTEHRLPSVAVPGQRGYRCSPVSGAAVARVVDDVRPDVVHVQGHLLVGRLLVTQARRRGLPVVATNHFLPDNLVPHLHLPRPLVRAVADLAWRDFVCVLGQADVVTAPTAYAARLAEERGLPGPVLPISCGMDLGRFSPANDGGRFRVRHGVPVDRPVVLYLGRLGHEKRVEEVVRAFALVRRTVDAHLVLVGDGHERRRLRALADGLGLGGAVTMTGFVDEAELPSAYAAADVFCNASVAELQSLVTLEAMATGKPVVGADAKALPHLVRDGENGYTFPPGDVPALAARLARLLADAPLRRAMGARSLAIAADHELGATLAAFEELYDVVVASRTAGRSDPVWRSAVASAVSG